MKLIFIRHGEPDYNHDSLTENGIREAKALADRVSEWKVTQFYVSPMGRAKETASYSLNKLNQNAITLDFLREFSYPIFDPYTNRKGVPWDFAPLSWTLDECNFGLGDSFLSFPCIKENETIKDAYYKTISGIDSLLEQYGYKREGKIYRNLKMEERFVSSTVGPNNEILNLGISKSNQDETTLVFFCHLGITCLILSHLLNIPFQCLTHGTFLPTTSVTVLSSEERWSNEAYFRAQQIGDTRHLYNNHIAVSPAGSFTNPFQY